MVEVDGLRGADGSSGGGLSKAEKTLVGWARCGLVMAASGERFLRGAAKSFAGEVCEERAQVREMATLGLAAMRLKALALSKQGFPLWLSLSRLALSLEPF